MNKKKKHQTTFNQQEIEISIQPLKSISEEYIIQYHDRLLPEYQQPPKTIVFIFFQCNLPLDGTNLKQEQLEKDRLLKEFESLSRDFYLTCQEQNISVEIICPRSGLPLYSKSGTDIFDLNTIVTRYLPSFQKQNGSCGLYHNIWGKAVYPCLILSWVEKVKIKPILLSIINKYDRLLLCSA